MSAVWLHVGQCGNQIGEEWWQILTSEKVPHAEADRHVDGVLLFQNDAVLRRTAALLARKEPVSDMQPQVSLSAMNTYVASCLAGLLYLLKAFTTGSGISMGMEPWELLRSVCPMPTMKFLHIPQACKRGTVFWDSLALSVVHSLPRASHAGRPHYSTSVLAVAHSYQEDTFLLSRDSVLRKLKQPTAVFLGIPSLSAAGQEAVLQCPTLTVKLEQVSWGGCAPGRHKERRVDMQKRFHYCSASLNIVEPGCQSHSLTVCANHSSSAELLQQVVARAEAMYKTNACLHWYWRYGCEEEDFQQAFETLCSVADDYSRLGE
ncbi:unnamed protein product [Caretta caretta]